MPPSSPSTSSPTGTAIRATWPRGGVSSPSALLRIAPVLGALAASPPGPPTNSEQARARARAALTTYLRYFGNPDVPTTNESDAAQISVDMTISSLFQLHVVVRSMLPTKVAVEQHVDIIQVSADTRSALTPEHPFATDKLTGLQFHHFGAFYKSSWRANDWMWGRLDGAGWLVHLLLDPHRIQVLAEAHCEVAGKREWFLARVRDRIPGLGTPDQRVHDELAYLDDPNLAVPPSLPNLSMWMATPFQEQVAVAELPVVAREVLVNPTSPGQQVGGGRAQDHEYARSAGRDHPGDHQSGHQRRLGRVAEVTASVVGHRAAAEPDRTHTGLRCSRSSRRARYRRSDSATKSGNRSSPGPCPRRSPSPPPRPRKPRRCPPS